MGKIHTHYDNLKVARLAPQEVIRAAYKALSQKYHPDKNPGDEKAARIMALLNTAYGTLADPQRRKEHDEWIAAEEWEIERAESIRQPGTWAHAGEAPAAARRRVQRGWKWWCALAACFGLGWLGGMFSAARLKPASAALALVWNGAGNAAPGRPEPAVPAGPAPAGPETAPAATAPPDVKVLALSQVVLPPAPAGCDGEALAPLAPNGEPWPLQSGYVNGFPISNKGADLQLTVDNSANTWPVLIKLYDLDRRSNVRYLFILPRDKLTIDQLAFGRYEVRYQRIDLGGAVDGCAAKKGAYQAPPVSSGGWRG